MKELIARLREDYCSCIDGYKSRGMTDPQCSSCDSKDWRGECADALERLTAELETEQGKSAKARLHEMENIRLTSERDAAYKTNEVLRGDIANPPSDVQEFVLNKYNFFGVVAERDALQATLDDMMKAMADVKRLTAENAALKEGLDGWHARNLDLEVEFARLVDVCHAAKLRLAAERDALRADAERLNWMEDALKCYFFQIQSQPSGAYVVQGYGKKLRAAIDAAIAGEKT